MNNLKLIAVAAIIVVSMVTLAACQGFAVSEPERLVISVWGGSYADNFNEHVAQPFAEKYGVEVVLDKGGSSQRLSKLLAMAGNPEVDLFYTTDYQGAVAEEEGLFLPVREENVPNIGELYEPFKDPLGNGCPAFTTLGVGFAYSKDRLTPPLPWSTLWREDLKNSVSLPEISNSTGPPILAHVASLNGGGPENIDPGFQAIQDLVQSNLQFFYSRSQEAVQAINQGDIAIATALNIFVSETEGQPIAWAWPEDGGIAIIDIICVVKGTQHRDLAEKFINFHLSREVQKAMALYQFESPANKTVVLENDQVKPNMLYGEEDIGKLIVFDASVLSAHRQEWIDRWNQEIITK